MAETPSHESRFSRYYRNISVIVMNVILLLVGLNVCAWIILEVKQSVNKQSSTPYKYRGYAKPLETVYPNFTPDQIDRICKDTRRLYMQYEPFLQHREAPYKSEFINVDRRGFRIIHDQAQFPPDSRHMNIFVFGGSTAFGYGVADSDTIASHLQEYLRGTAGVQADVYNFGRAHYASTQEKMLFEQFLLAGHVPNIAVFIDGLNEFVHYDGSLAFTYVLEKFFASGDIPPERKIMLRLPIIRLLVPERAYRLSLWEPLPDSGQAGENGPTALNLSKAIDRYLANKDRIEKLARDFGVKTLFVWQPVPVYNYDMTHHLFAGYDYEASYPQVKAGYMMAAKRLKDSASGGNFLWIAEMQTELKEPLYVSAFHYGPKMSALIAQSIGPKLQPLAKPRDDANAVEQR